MLGDFEGMIGGWKVSSYSDDRGKVLKLVNEGTSIERISFRYDEVDEPIFEETAGEGTTLTLSGDFYGLVVFLPTGDSKPFVELIEVDSSDTLAMMEVPRAVANAVFLIARDQMPDEEEEPPRDPEVVAEPEGGRKKRRRTLRKKKKGTARRTAH